MSRPGRMRKVLERLLFLFGGYLLGLLVMIAVVGMRAIPHAIVDLHAYAFLVSATASFVAFAYERRDIACDFIVSGLVLITFWGVCLQNVQY